MATDSGTYTPETIARRMKFAEQLLDLGKNPPIQHWTQGLNELAKGYVGGRMFAKAEGMEKEGRKAANEALIQMLMPGGGGAAPGMPSAAPQSPAGVPAPSPAPGPGAELAALGIRPQDGTTLFATPADKAVQEQSAATMADPTNPMFVGSQPGQGGPNGELGAAIVQHATAAGLDPKDVATAMSYETGGTLDPWKRGPTTKWGTHRGLIQWGEPQARQYGVTQNMPVGDQVKAAIQYLKDRGVQPGAGLMQIYSAINAGGVGPQFESRSDAAAGGAPGTVADKVNNQMGGHRKIAEQLIAGAGSGPTAPWQMPQAQPSAFEPQAAQQPPTRQGGASPISSGANPMIVRLIEQLRSPNSFVQRQAHGIGQQVAAGLMKPADLELKTAGDAAILFNPKTGQYQQLPLSATKPEFTTIGQDEFGRPRYGFVDKGGGKVTPYEAPKQPPQPGEPAIPPAPPGVDPKQWREKRGERVISESMPADDEKVGKLRKEVQDLPSYKNIAQAAPVYKSMLDAAGRDNRAADVNLIYGLAKVMDPGSVVRESEMTVAQAVATLPQALQAQITSQLNATGRLSPEVRAAIMQEARSRLLAYQGMYDQDAAMYRGIAQRGRMNEADVLQSFGPFDEFKPPAAAAPAAAAPAPGAPPVGTVKDGWRFKGGDPAKPENWEQVS